MTKTGKTFFYFILVTLICLPSMLLGFEVTATVDKTRITREDSIFLRIIVHGGKAEPDTSLITDFKVYPRGTSSSYQYINGQSERKTTYQYALIPLADGQQLLIPAIPVQMDGQTAHTQPISIQVTRNVVDPDQVKALFAQASVSSARLFTGQQAVYTIKFFTSKRLSGVAFENQPDFKGLTAKAFDSERRYSLNVDGQLFNVIQVDYLIIASSPGTVTIDPASFIAKVPIRIQRDPSFNSIFDDSFFSSTQYKPVRVVSNPVDMDIVQLPVYKGSEKFSGLVGKFDIQAALDRTRLVVGESATLTIEVSGTGNIMDAGQPQIDLDDQGFKVYDDTPVDVISLDESGYQGSRTFKKALVPVKAGNYQIEPLALVYFDIDKKAYQTAVTQPIQVNVRASNGKDDPDAASVPGNHKNDPSVEKEDVSILNKDILDIKTGLSVLKDDEPLSMLRFLIFLLSPALLFTCFKFFAGLRQKDRSSRQVMMEKAKKHLKLAGKTRVGEKIFLSHLYTALTAAVLSKSGKTGESVTMNEIRTILANVDTDKQTIDTVSQLMQTIESVRFGGRKIDEHSARQIFSTAKQVIKKIGCVLVCLVAITLMAQDSRADVAADFTQAVKLYEAGDFSQAAQWFEKVVNVPVRNPYLYYNLGNAYLKAGDIGHAILWYERAKLMAPNDPDLEFNLKYANTMVKDKKDAAIDYVDLLFFWDALIGVKPIQYAAIALCFVFFGWAMIRTVAGKQVFSGTGILLISLLGISLGLAGINYYKQAFVRTAVVVVSEVQVRSGISPDATPLFSLHAGSMVKVKEKRNDALKIEFSKDRVGWIGRDAAGIVQDMGVNTGGNETVRTDKP